MSNATSHIGCLRLRLHCNQTGAASLQQRASRLCSQRLQTLLDSLLAEPAQAGAVARLPQPLVLDLGDLPLEDFEEAFLDALLARWRELLSGAGISHDVSEGSVERWAAADGRMRAIPPGSSASLANRNPSGSTSDGKAWQSAGAGVTGERDAGSANAPADLDAEALSPAVALVLYLRSGYWPLPQAWQDASPSNWLLTQLRQPGRDWDAVLTACCEEPVSMGRLRKIFRPAALQALVAELDIVASKSAATGTQAAMERQARWERLSWEFDAYLAEAAKPNLLRASDEAQPLRLDKVGEIGPLPTVRARKSPARASLAPDQQASTEPKSLLPDIPASVERSRASANPALAPPALLAVSNAGLVILWPMLARLFRQLELLDEQRFIDAQAQVHAVCWLDWLLWNDRGTDADIGGEAPDDEAQWRTPFTKWLCGLPPEWELPAWEPPTAAQRALLLQWLAQCVGLCPSLQRLGVEGVRALFLRRNGRLLQESSHGRLVVEADACDILLRELAWPVRELRLPWLLQPLVVDWLPA